MLRCGRAREGWLLNWVLLDPSPERKLPWVKDYWPCSGCHLPVPAALSPNHKSRPRGTALASSLHQTFVTTAATSAQPVERALLPLVVQGLLQTWGQPWLVTGTAAIMVQTRSFICMKACCDWCRHPCFWLYGCMSRLLNSLWEQLRDTPVLPTGIATAGP
jgi:hypothetical protein